MVSSSAAGDSVTFDFEDILASHAIGGAGPGAYTSLRSVRRLHDGPVGMDLSRTSGAAFDVLDSRPFFSSFFPDRWGDHHLDPFVTEGLTPDAFRAVFSAPRPIVGVSIEMGDFDQDSDNAVFEVYDTLGGLLFRGGTAYDIEKSLRDRDLVRFAFGTSIHRSIGSIRFKTTGSFDNSVYYDNIGVIFIPLPASFWLGLTGLCAVAGVTRRRFDAA